MNKEIKTDHFRTLEDLLENCKMWIREEDYYAYNRYFEMQCMEEMYEYIVELQQENEKLNHYKLLYQKVKDRNDKAIEYINKNKRIYDVDGTKENMLDEFDILASPKSLLEILKGNNEE